MPSGVKNGPSFSKPATRMASWESFTSVAAGLRWYPKSSRYHHFMSWRRFGEVIEQNVRKTP